MSKNDYRSFFANVRNVIKIRHFLKIVGIPESTFSLFMRGEEWNYMLSIDRCNTLYDTIMEWCRKIA